MSDSGSDKGWTFVNDNNDVEQNSDDGSTSSSDFVHLEQGDTVSYHHKSRSSSVESDDPELVTNPREVVPDMESTQVVPNPDEQVYPAEPETSQTQCIPELKADQCSENSNPELLQCSQNSSLELVEPETSETLDQEVVCALTSSGSVEAIPAVDMEHHVPDDVTVASESVESLDDNRSTGISLSWEENQWYWDDEVISPGSDVMDDPAVDADVSADNDSMEYIQEVVDNASQSSSDIEELQMPDSLDAAGVMEDPGKSQDNVALTLPSIESLKRTGQSKSSDSESDFSDIVRIDNIPAEEMPSTSAAPRPHHYFRAVDLMQVSASSSTSGSSNSGSRFHFVHPLPGNHRYVYPREDEEDVQSLPGDVDDRCESDISGVAPDDSDPDLSTISYDLDQLEIFEGDVVRSYKHRPNSNLNAFLTVMALLALFTTIGIALGHYVGTTRQVILRSMQGVRIKEIQDEYLGCLRQQGILQAQISVTDEQKIAAVTAVWKQKYEELIIEKVDLEWTMKQLQKQMDDGLQEAQNKLLIHPDEAQLLVKDISNIHHDDEQQIHQRELKLSQAETNLNEKELAFTEKDMHLLQTEARLNIEEEEYMEKQTQLNKWDTELGNLKAELIERRADLSEAETRLKEDDARLAEREVAVSEREAGVSEREIEVVRRELEVVRRDIEEVRREMELERSVLGQDTQDEEASGEDIKTEHSLDNVQEISDDGTEPQPTSRPPLEKQQHIDMDDINIQADEAGPSLGELRNLQEQVNFLETENADLRHQVALVRYSSYQQTNEQLEAESQVNTELKQQANNLANENLDLKAVVGKLRYTEHLDDISTDVPGEVDADPQEPESGFEPLNNPDSSTESGPENDVVPSLWSYLSVLIPDVDLSDLKQVISTEKLYNLTQPLVAHVEFIQNITSDINLTETLSQKWQKLQKLVGHENTKTVGDKVQSALGDMKDILTNEYDEFQKYMNSDVFRQRKEAVTDRVSSVVDTISNTTVVARYQEFVNKTKDCVTKLSHKIKKTWHKVKNLTGDFLQKNEALNDFGDTVSKSMKSIGKKVESGWKRARKHMVKRGLVPESWKSGDGKKAKSRKGKVWQKNVYNGKIPQQQHTTYYPEFEKDGEKNKDLPRERKEFEKPEHKKKQSSNMDYEKYEEYWRQAEFEPDDFLEEGFFQGNNRRWDKHQKKARKLHGRLQRLNNDMFLTMDDDDMDDMYEDFEDLQDDVDDMEQVPEQMMAWLTCQVRWWKSRLYRKHSNEDLVKGCGRQLMHWQLSALCKPCSPVSKKCRKNKGPKGTDQGPFCQYYQSVILPSIKQGQPGAADPQQGCDDGIKSSRILSLSLDSDTTYIDGHMENAYGRLHYSMSQDGDEVIHAADHHNVTDDDTREPSAKWLFERAEDRESHHHDGSWLFKRGNVRHFERTKPWYYERAAKRADHRTDQPKPRHYDKKNYMRGRK